MAMKNPAYPGRAAGKYWKPRGTALTGTIRVGLKERVK